jgi:uncharacterized protein
MKIEIKTTGLVKDVDVEKRIITGYFTSNGTIDSDNDVFADGSFKKTIKDSGPKGKNRIWHLWQHDSDKPINKPYLLEERSEGVYFETKLLNTEISKLALALYEAGSISEHSVGFMTVKSDEEKGVRVIKEVKMLEGSTVLWGANPNTPFVGMKAEQAIEILNVLEKLLKNGTFEQNEIFELIELNICQIKAALEPGNPLEPQTIQEPQQALKNETADTIKVIKNTLKFIPYGKTE